MSVYHCDCCGKEKDVECLYAVEVDGVGKVYCKECVLKTDNYTFCVRCGSFTKKDNLTIDDDWICNDCRDNRYDFCDCCERWVDYNNLGTYEVGNTYYCEYCLSDRVNSGEIYWCEDCEEYCLSRSPCEHSGFPIHNYSYSPDKFNFYSYNSTEYDCTKKYIGVELEVSVDYSVSSYIVNNREDFIYCKSDSSVHHGFEIVSHPATFDYHKSNNWKDIFEVLNEFNALNHHTCGLHFHINRGYFNKQGLRNLDYFVNKYYRKMQEIGGRNFNHYCNLKTDLHRRNLGTGYHTSSVNFSNRNTIEIRFCASTVDYNTFITRMMFINDIVSFCNNQKTIASTTWKNFKNFINQ